MTTADAAARARIREELDTSFLVEAAAGTGKTTETVHRIVASIAAGRVEAPGLVAISFTRKAAGELSLRLRRALEQAAHASSGVEARRLVDALVHLDEAQLGTIHGFCGELLRRHPVEAGVDPEFERLDDGQSRALFAEVFRSWFEAKLDGRDPRFQRALAFGQTYSWNDQGPWEQLTSAAWKLVEERRHPAPWPRAGVDWKRDIVDFSRRAAALGQALAARSPDQAHAFTQKKLDALVEFGVRLSTRDAEDWAPEELEAALGRAMQFTPPSKRGQIGEHSAAELAREAESLASAWKTLRPRLDADFVSELRDLLWEVAERYEARKQRLGKLDYLDLLLRCRGLLDHEEVRDGLREELQLVFVDEFQDTDPLQAHIVERVSRIEEGGLFIVGDPKQSIYSFRGADMDFYLEFATGLERKGVARLELTHSFRAVGPIQGFVNEAFRTAFETDETQPNYVPLTGGPAPSDRMPPPVVAFTSGRQSSLYAKYDEGRRRSGQTTGRLIQWILEDSYWKIRDPEDGSLVPVRAEHIGVLLRSMSKGADPDAWVRSLVRELDRRHVPWLLHGRRYLDDRSEVAGLLACLMAIEWPNDRYWMYAALRSPLFHFPDDLLAEWMAFVGPLHPSTARPEGEPRFEGLADALGLFDELSRERNARSVPTTIEALLGATRAVAGFAHEHSGPEAVAGVRGVLALAERHEREQQSGFRTFVERLETLDAESLGETQLEASGVRILNIHQVKGLEFPIVILGDPFDSKTIRRERHVEGQAKYVELLGLQPEALQSLPPLEGPGEELRVAYVAATRARDCLIVASKPTGPFDRRPAWTGPVEYAVMPPAGSEPEPSTHWAHGEPCCRTDRPPKNDDQVLLSGRHEGVSGVVDWMPSGLFDRPRTRLPILRQRAALEEGDAADAATASHRTWRTELDRRLARGREASIVLLRPSETEDEPRRGMARRVRTVRVEQAPGRPRGRRFGHLVHEVLRHAFDSELEVALEAAARQVDASDEERSAARLAVQRALADPMLVQARASDERACELPVCRRSEEGLLLDGVVDLFFQDESGRGVVLDYKTHEELDEDEAKRQIAWYLWALEPSHGSGLRGVLFVL